MKRKVLFVVTTFVLSASPAGAINDLVSPADNCAPDNAQAVGHPAAPHLLGTGQISAFPVAANTPGASTEPKSEGAAAFTQCPAVNTP
jgi:hypothetical protein